MVAWRICKSLIIFKCLSIIGLQIGCIFAVGLNPYAMSVDKNMDTQENHFGETVRPGALSVAVRPKSERIVMGIDPGTNLLGYGVLSVKGRSAKMLAMGVIDLRRVKDVYLKLGRIYERIGSLISSFLPDELSIESQFYGKNPQSMLKLGRAQGVAIAAAINKDVPIREYAPLKIKMAITGNGRASKEQVAAMLQRYLNIEDSVMLPYLDATDALAAAYCHFVESYCKVYEGSGVDRNSVTVSRNLSDTPGSHHTTKWADYVKNNPGRISGLGSRHNGK